MRLDLAGFDWVVEATCCKLAMAVTLKSDGGVQGWLMCKALGWQVHTKDLWVDQAMVERRRDSKLVTARVRDQHAELEC